MAKVFTEAIVRRLNPGEERRTIRDGGARSLYLVIQPSGTKSWMMRFRGPGGKAAKIVLGPVDLSGLETEDEPIIGMPLTLSAARHVAAQVHRQRARGGDVFADHKAAKHRRKAAAALAGENSFAAAARVYVTEHARPKVRGWRELARLLGLDPDSDGLEATADGLASRWADRDLRKIDGHDVWSVVDEARRVGVPGIEPRRREASESRPRMLHAALSGFFGWAVRHRRADVNPCSSAFKPDAPKARDRVLTDDEIKKFWLATKGVSQPFGAVLQLLLLTGLRLNEVAQMRWTELIDDHATLNLPGTRTKNHRAHVVPLAPLARDVVRRQPRIDGCDFVFTTNGRTAVSGWSKTKASLDAKTKIAPWRIHDLRRTAVTGMAELGIAPDLIELMVNHVSGSRAGVAGIYNRSERVAERRAALERWAAHVLGVVEGRKANVASILRPKHHVVEA